MLHFIFGTRAQIIKMAPLMVECQKRGIKYNFIFLAQHKETMYEMMDMFGIRRPDYVIGDVGVDITSTPKMFFWSWKVLIKGALNLKKIFKGDKDGIAVVHGDAPPLLLGALIAKLYGLKVAHIEAGLRSHNFFHPFPEELTRVLTWKLGLVNYYFCQNRQALKNVKHYKGSKFLTKYNTLLDSWRIAKGVQGKIKVKVPREKYCLVSIHRFETISRRKEMEKLVNILIDVSKRMKLLFILHPPTKVALKKYCLLDKLKKSRNIELRPRYKFFEFTKLVYGSEFFMTDGGSNQEESFYIGKPCLLYRKTTERSEGLEGNVVISKFKYSRIFSFFDNYWKYKDKGVSFSISPSRLIINKLVSL